VTADASAQNLGTLAFALFQNSDKAPLSSKEAAEVQKLLSRALELDPRDEYLLSLRCEFAIKQENISALHSCVEKLESVAPESPRTIYMAWVLAMSKNDWDQAEATIARARKAKAPDAMVRTMQEGLDNFQPFWRRWLGLGLGVIGAWAGLMLLLTVAGLSLSRMTLNHAEALSTASAGPEDGSTLKRIYAAVLVVCCGLFYLSLPLVMLAVIGVGGGVIYAMLAVGQVSIKLALLAVLMVFVSLSAVIKSLAARASDEEPGLKLDLSREPKLRQALDEVAGRIGTRPVDTVYITPDTSVAVFERKHGERCLVLGAGVMEGMPLAAFKAVLAHEYGHFSNRDTAGGGFALRVRRSLLMFIVHLAAARQATVWNPAWWFAKGFYLLFLRISQGASRLQEILADRHAALAYGGRAFAQGLRHVIERDVHFGGHAELEVKRAVESGSALRSLWAAGEIPKGAADQVEEAMNRAPSPYDSHPAPRDRIRWVGGITGAAEDTAVDAESTVWDLFSDRPWLEREMTLVVYQRLAMRGIRLAPLPASS
jgi:Zn-dependent protease with chaperone function